MAKKSKPKPKTKISKRSGASDSAPQQEMPDLVAAMMKIAERLESVERKMDQILNRPMESRQQGQAQPQRQNFQSHQQPSHVHHQGQHHQHSQHGQKTLYQAVCADCRKPCEVPFKPTGERPVYCKECFAKRKSGGNGGNGNHGNQISKQPAMPSGQPSMHLRQVRVTPNGAGKVTVSEVVRKSPKPGKKFSKSR